MFIKSPVSIAILFAVYEACAKLTGSEHFGNGVYDFLGKSQSKMLGPGDVSIPSQPSFAPALPPNKHLLEPESSARNPKEMDGFLELRLSVGSQSISQDAARGGSTKQEKEPTASSAGSRSWLSMAVHGGISSSDGKHPSQGQKSTLPGSDNYATNTESYIQPEIPQPEDVELDKAHLGGIAADFWKPKTVKVIPEVYHEDETSRGLIEVKEQPSDSEKLKLRYPEEESIQISDRKLYIPFTFLTNPKERWFECIHRKLSNIIGFIYGKNFRGRTITVTKHRRASDILDESIVKGNEELKELGLPNSLSEFPVEEFSSIHSKEKKRFAASSSQLKRLASTIEKESEYEEGSLTAIEKQSTRTLASQTKRRRKLSVPSSNPTKVRKVTQNMELNSKNDAFNNRKIEPKITAPVLTEAEGYKCEKLVLSPTVRRFDVTRALLAYSLPAIIHDIRVLCEAYPQIREITQKTARELQYNAWHFYHTLMNNIELLYSYESGKELWEAHSIITHTVFKTMIEELEATRPTYNFHAMASAVTRKFLAFWMSCYCKELSQNIPKEGWLQTSFVGILNEFYEANARV